MSALHREWLADQADKLRATAAHDARHCAGINQELDAWANPSTAVKSAAQKVRETLKTQRQARDISNQNKDQA